MKKPKVVKRGVSSNRTRVLITTRRGEPDRITIWAKPDAVFIHKTRKFTMGEQKAYDRKKQAEMLRYEHKLSKVFANNKNAVDIIEKVAEVALKESAKWV